MNTGSIATSVETIRSAATSVLEAIDAPDHTELRDGLEHLRDTITEARRIGTPEGDIEKALNDVRQLHPDVAETWSEILEQLEVSVWLQDPDGERVRGDSEIIDRIIWENWDDDEILEEAVQQLRDDLEANWEVVGVVSESSASPLRKDEDKPTAHRIECHHVISGTETKGWVHTHGMDQFGLPELEIRNVPAFLAVHAAAILRTVCDYMIDSGKKVALAETMAISDQSVVRFEKAEPMVGQENHYDTERWQIVEAECRCSDCGAG
jgi:hypothetical protein